jgi:hypothetical protein
MVVGLYVAGIGIIVAVAWGYYAFERRQASSVATEQINLPRPTTRAPASYPAPATYYQAARAKADESLRHLRESLAESQKLLEQRNQALTKKNAECQSLKQELDQSFMIILNLLAEDSSNSNQLEESAQSAAHARSKLESELTRLIEALNQAESLGAEQDQQLSRLRGDLLQADMEFAVLRDQAEMEVASLIMERSNFESLVNGVLVRCGPAAVPVVAERLEDERVEVRRWAARTLALFGLDALAAADSLRRSLSDPDAAVREEAQRSIQILEGREVVGAVAR